MSEPNANTTESPDVFAPVPVKIIETETYAPDFGSLQSYILTGTEPPQRILPQAPKRHRAQIWALPGFTDDNVDGNVYIGTRSQVEHAQGGILVVGQDMTLESQQELWLAPDGTHAITVTVLDERYQV